QRSGERPDLHSFPTRRSSDLVERLASESEPLDVVTLAEFLERAGDIEDAGGLTYLAELAEKTPGAANIRAYAEIVRERSILRQLDRKSTRLNSSHVKISYAVF